VSDYAAAPAQPIVQGLVTVIPEGEISPGSASFFGIGALPTVLYNGPGDYTLTLDKGLPGDVAVTSSFGRVMLTIRATAPGTPTVILGKSHIFIVNAVPGVGADKIEILFADLGGDPADASFEIIVWRGDAGVELTNVKLVGGPPVILIP
jgi:hypothetical protein